MTYQKLIYHLGIFILLLSACSNQADREDKDTAGYIPQAPDYADPNLWYTRENNQVEQGADVLSFSAFSLVFPAEKRIFVETKD